MKLINIYNSKRLIYKFLREDEGSLKIEKDNSFFPYYYELNKEGKWKTIDGLFAKKIFVSEPSAVPKSRSINSYEADILFCKRYLIDRVKQLDKTIIKYAFVDMECLTDELPDEKEAKYTISCISIYNSMYKSIQTFYLGNYGNEIDLINDFIRYMKREKFDLWLSWYVKFDYNYVYNRYNKLRNTKSYKENFATKISPINQSRYGGGEVYYPAGISIVDYLIWDKKVTLNRRKSYTLNEVIREEFGIERKKIDFSKLLPELKKKNIEDVKYLAKLEDKKHYVDYFDEIRRVSKIEWEDMNFNSRVIDMLLLQEGKEKRIVLPMKPTEERGTLEEKGEYAGAYRDAFKLGRFENIGVYDLTSAYPSMLVDFCLDPTNIVEKEGNEIKTGIIIEGNKFKQNQSALLPTVVKKLLTLKNDIKSDLEKCPLNSGQYKDIKQTYDAIKGIVNSAYGVFGNRFFRLYCYSEDTEILTEDGWKYWFDINKGTNVASYNINTDKVEFQSILNLNVQKVENQEMIHFQNKRTDQLITPHHKVLYLDKKGNKYISFAKDAKIYHREFPLVRELTNNKLDYPISDELLKIHAWIITEGTDEYKSNNVLSFKNSKSKSRWRIVQSLKANKKYCEEIDLIFKKLGWNIYSNITGFIKRWDIYTKYSEYIKLEKNYKAIPLWMLKKLSLRQLKLLYEELIKGDGTKVGCYYSAKDELARDRFQYLCTLLGIATIKRKYAILINHFKNVTISTSRYKKEVIKYSGIVWCPTVKNRFVVMRRKGKVFISGNSKQVASATTYLVRDLLHYVQDKLEAKGHEIIYVDTDSIMLSNNNEDISNTLNDLVKQWGKEKYNKDDVSVRFEYEGYFNPIIILAKCRYKGWLVTSKGIETKTKGIEARRKDSTVYIRKFQIELLAKIKDKESKEKIFEWIKNEIKNLPNQSLKDISFPCKLARKAEDYVNTPIFVRALKNTPNFKKKVGDLFYYIFVKPTGEPKITTNIYVDNELIESLDKNLTRKEGIDYINIEDYIEQSENDSELAQKITKIDSKRIKVLHQKDKPKDVMAFDDTNFKHITKDIVDWDMMIKRNVLMKLETVFSAMKWDVKEIILCITPKIVPKTSIISPVKKDLRLSRGKTCLDKKEFKQKLTEVVENKEVVEIKSYYEE